MQSGIQFEYPIVFMTITTKREGCCLIKKNQNSNPTPAANILKFAAGL
jgi:hypothetical protein